MPSRSRISLAPSTELHPAVRGGNVLKTLQDVARELYPSHRRIALNALQVGATIGLGAVDLNDSFDLEAYIATHAEWSRATFGDGADIRGQVAHIRKELDEILAASDDITEPVDVIILALDILTRRGHTPAEICAALAEKQAVNKARKWPKPEAGKPTEHIRETP